MGKMYKLYKIEYMRNLIKKYDEEVNNRDLLHLLSQVNNRIIKYINFFFIQTIKFGKNIHYISNINFEARKETSSE